MKISFHVPKSQARTIELQNGIQVRHVYPTLIDFFGGKTPSHVNPRTHGDECLKGKLPREIEDTIREEPANFVLANRGCTIVATDVSYDAKEEMMTLTLDKSTDSKLQKALTGMVDGATTDAVIAKIQANCLPLNGSGEIPEFLTKSQLHLEIFTGVSDREILATLAEGRNTGRQVKGWSMANFRGRYRWLEDLFADTDFAASIAYEENADDKAIEILDIIAILNLFHKSYCDGSTKSPTVSYNSKKQGLLRRIEDEMSDTAKDLELLKPVVFDILQLRDQIFSDIPGHWDGRPGSIFKTYEKPISLPFSAKITATHPVPDGVLYPMLASLRCLLTYEDGPARWLMDPFKFWTKHGQTLVEKLHGLLDTPMYTSVTQFGQKAGNYTALLDAAENCYFRSTRRK